VTLPNGITHQKLHLELDLARMIQAHALSSIIYYSAARRKFFKTWLGHTAYQASGIWAIKEAVILENETITDLDAWKKIDKGIQENLQSEINKGNKETFNP
jgi:hypothetical protein